MAKWPTLVLVVVWLMVHYSERLARAWAKLSLALDLRAARKAALAAKTSKDREHALDVLRALQSAPEELAAALSQPSSAKRQAKNRP